MKDSLKDADIPEEHTPIESKESEPPLQPEKSDRPFFRRALRWLLVMLLVFGLGGLLVLYTLYLPAQREIGATKADLQKANQQIDELEARVASLSALETKNQELQEELDDAVLQVNILRARADVSSALLALAKNDPAKARVALSQTNGSIEAIGGLLDPGQQKVVTDMQARLKLAAGEIGDNTFAAESDLNVLATSLLELENSYFTSP